MGREVSTSSGLSGAALDAIADRLSSAQELYLPHSSFAGRSDQQVSHQEKKNYLLALLHRDAAIFLERYGSKLLLSEVAEFECLKDDYEVNWHLKNLKQTMDPSPVEQRSKAAAVKNRRLAFLEQLVQDGHYFSEEEMRRRCPFLHHEYVGRFQDPSTWSFARRGDKMADVLIRHNEEAFIQRKMDEERQRFEAAEEEEEEEEEDDEDEEKEEDQDRNRDEQEHDQTNKADESYTSEVNALCCLQLSDDGDAGTSSRITEMPRPRPNASARSGNTQDGRLQAFTEELMAKFMAADDEKDRISPEELQCKLDDFTRVMQEKFLSGEDAEHIDYAGIDANAALDDHWLPEVSHEAEEKYFGEDDV